MDLKGQVLGGRYHVQSELGRGGMGVVYRCHDQMLDRAVAMKLMNLGADPVALERFNREARLVAGLRHPNIIQVLDIGALPSGHPFFVMPFVPGKPMDELIRQGRLAPEESAEIIAKVARALQVAHESRILHRDIKPANILVEDATGEPLLLDFGLVREHTTKATGQSLTVEGAILGTLQYMSPEQADGQRVDHRADIYSLGATLYEALAGKPAFNGEGVSQILLLKQIFDKMPEPPDRAVDDLPPGLSDVVMRCLAKSPVDRYQTAADLAEALEDELGTGARSMAEPEQRASGTGLLLALGALMLPLLLGGLWLMMPRKGTIQLTADIEGASVRVGLERARTLKPGESISVPVDAGEVRVTVIRDDVKLNKSFKVNSGQLIASTLDLSVPVELRSKLPGTVTWRDPRGRQITKGGASIPKLELPAKVVLPIGQVELVVEHNTGYTRSVPVLVRPDMEPVDIALDPPVIYDTAVPEATNFWARPGVGDLDGDGIKDLVYTYGGRGIPGGLARLVAISSATGEPLWRFREFSSFWTSPYVIETPEGPRVFITGIKDKTTWLVYRIDGRTGKELGRTEVPCNRWFSVKGYGGRTLDYNKNLEVLNLRNTKWNEANPNKKQRPMRPLVELTREGERVLIDATGAPGNHVLVPKGFKPEAAGLIFAAEMQIFAVAPDGRLLWNVCYVPCQPWSLGHNTGGGMYAVDLDRDGELDHLALQNWDYVHFLPLDPARQRELITGDGTIRPRLTLHVPFARAGNMAVSPEGKTLFCFGHKASGSKQARMFVQGLDVDLAPLSGRSPDRVVDVGAPYGDLAFANVIGDEQSELILYTVPSRAETPPARETYTLHIFSGTGREIQSRTFQGTSLSMTVMETDEGPVIAVAHSHPKAEVVFYKADGLRELNRRPLSVRPWMSAVDLFDDGRSELSVRINRRSRILLLGENCWKPQAGN